MLKALTDILSVVLIAGIPIAAIIYIVTVVFADPDQED